MLARRWRLARRFGDVFLHAGAVELVSLDDGELEPGREARLRRHLQRCPRCRLRQERLDVCRKRLAEAMRSEPAASPAEGGAKRLLSLLRDGSWLETAEQRLLDDVRRRLVAELRPYVGAQAAAVEEEDAQARGGHAEERLLRLASVFLGREAAAVLLERAGGDFDARLREAACAKR